MPSVTPIGTGVVNLAGPLTRHHTGGVFTMVGAAGTSAAPTMLDYTAATANAAGTRVTVDISAYAPSALQVWNLGSATLFVSVDDEDPTAGECNLVPVGNGFQIDMPSAGLPVAIWSAAGGEAFAVRAFLQSSVVP
jgi:hypothetical protein